MDYTNTHSSFNQFLDELNKVHKPVKIQLDERGQPVLDKNGRPVECCGGKGKEGECSCRSGYKSILPQ